MTELYVKVYDRKDPRLGRVVVHDDRSRGFAAYSAPDMSTWESKRNRIWDPYPNPNQCHGECTYVAQNMLFNAAGNRRLGVVLDMDHAHTGYSLATTLDPLQGAWVAPTWDDTGSNGLAACKASQQLGDGGTYRFIFTRAAGVGQAVQDGKVVAVGTRWDWRMFDQDPDGRVQPGGGVAGGHEWVVRGWDERRNWYLGRCWWGDFRDFWISAEHLDELLADDGDAHVQERA